MKIKCSAILVWLVMVGISSNLCAEEKNGLQVTVQKTTLDRADQRGGYYYSDRIDRTLGLKVAVKNISFKAMPAGTVDWRILVRKYYSTTVAGYQGTEKIEPLKPSEQQDFTIGAAQITGWRDGSQTTKDKIEWQVSIKQGGQEILKLSSTPSFDTLAKRAIKVASPAKSQ